MKKSTFLTLALALMISPVAMANPGDAIMEEAKKMRDATTEERQQFGRGLAEEQRGQAETLKEEAATLREGAGAQSTERREAATTKREEARQRGGRPQ